MTERVHLIGYPVALGLSLAENVEEWMREFKLIAFGQDSGVVRNEVPARLQQMVQDLRQRYARELSEPDRRRAEAAARGDATVDLSYPVLPEAEQVARAWQRMLTEVDEYCRAEQLLTLQRTPDQVLLVDWITEEFLGQLEGRPPRPWSEVASPTAPAPAVDLVGQGPAPAE